MLTMKSEIRRIGAFLLFESSAFSVWSESCSIESPTVLEVTRPLGKKWWRSGERVPWRRLTHIASWIMLRCSLFVHQNSLMYMVTGNMFLVISFLMLLAMLTGFLLACYLSASSKCWRSRYCKSHVTVLRQILRQGIANTLATIL